MKLVEAILLGSTVLTAKAGGQHFSGGQAGCALGMAEAVPFPRISCGGFYRGAGSDTPPKSQAQWNSPDR
jgi:hypothetical protein